MTQKIISVFLSMVLLANLAACAESSTQEPAATSSPPQVEAASPSPAPADPADTPAGEKDDTDRLAAYRFALEQIAYEHIYPDGTDIGFDGESGFIEDNRFALCDVTGNGTAELIVQFTTGPMAANMETVYTWREGALTSILTAFPAVTYYTGGWVVELWSHGDYLTGDEWPYNLYQYDGGKYELVAEVNMWSREADTVNYQGDPYPEDIDAEGAGIVYILTRNGVTATVSKSEYETWLDSLLGSESEMTIPYQPLAEGNIQALG